LVIQAQWTRHQQCMCTIYNSMCLLAYMLVKFIVQCVSRKTEFSRGHELTISQGWSGGGGGGMTNQFLLCFIIHGAMGPQQYRYMQENHGSLGYGLTVTGRHVAPSKVRTPEYRKCDPKTKVNAWQGCFFFWW
jgi:hypothetical protein